MRIKVDHKWVATPEDTFDAGEHEVKGTKKLLKAVALAQATGGVIEVLEASPEEQAGLEGHVESDEDSLKAYEAAQASGEWQRGNVEDFLATNERSADDARLTEEAQAAAAANAELGRHLLASLDSGLSWDDAVGAWQADQAAATAQAGAESAPSAPE